MGSRLLPSGFYRFVTKTHDQFSQLPFYPLSCAEYLLHNKFAVWVLRSLEPKIPKIFLDDAFFSSIQEFGMPHHSFRGEQLSNAIKETSDKTLHIACLLWAHKWKLTAVVIASKWYRLTLIRRGAAKALCNGLLQLRQRGARCCIQFMLSVYWQRACGYYYCYRRMFYIINGQVYL